MSRNYVILTLHLFTRRDWVRFGCEALVQRGYSVKIVQCGGVLEGINFSELERTNFISIPEVIVPLSATHIETILDDLSPRDLIVNIVPLSKNTAWLYKEIARRKLTYSIVYLGQLPCSEKCGGRTRQSLMHAAKCYFDEFKHLASRIKDRLALIFAVGPSYFLLPAPLLWIRGGIWQHSVARDCIGLRKSNVVEVEGFEIQWARACAGNSLKLPGQPYALFIDEAMCDHPDYQISNLEMPTEPEPYFSGLRRTFDKVESELGLPVVIAPHPKASYSEEELKKNFGNRKVVYGNTPNLVANADLVFSHVSTTVSIVALYRKPVIFLTSDHLEKSFLQPWLIARASWLNQPLINMDRLADSNCEPLSLPCVDEAHYQEFVTYFIRSPNAHIGPIWDYVADRFEELTANDN